MNKYQKAYKKILKGYSQSKDTHNLSDDLDTLQELVERATPKKVIDWDRVKGDFPTCPNCQQVIVNDCYNPKYCEDCGQALDLGDSE